MDIILEVEETCTKVVVVVEDLTTVDLVAAEVAVAHVVTTTMKWMDLIVCLEEVASTTVMIVSQLEEVASTTTMTASQLEEAASTATMTVSHQEEADSTTTMTMSNQGEADSITTMTVSNQEEVALTTMMTVTNKHALKETIKTTKSQLDQSTMSQAKPFPVEEVEVWFVAPWTVDPVEKIWTIREAEIRISRAVACAVAEV